MRIAPSLVPRAGVALGAVLMAAGLLGGTAAQAADGADADQTVVQGTTGLSRGQSWSSPDGSTVLYQQYDGHVVLYKNNVAIWTAVGTYGVGSYLYMQADGNLVAYDAAMRAVWNSRTPYHPGAYLAIQNGGNLAVYYGSTPIWWSNYRPGGGTGPIDPDPECTPTPHRLCP